MIVLEVLGVSLLLTFGLLAWIAAAAAYRRQAEEDAKRREAWAEIAGASDCGKLNINLFASGESKSECSPCSVSHLKDQINALDPAQASEEKQWRYRNRICADRDSRLGRSRCCYDHDRNGSE